jgi:uncharacterized membrane protein YccC
MTETSWWAAAGSSNPGHIISNPSPPQPIPKVSRFWLRESSHIKQGIESGTAGLIAYAMYAAFPLPEGSWAVFTALVVTQANLGAS